MAQTEQTLRPSRTWTRARGLDLRTWNIAVLRPQAQCPPGGRGRQGASSWEHGCSSSPCGYGLTLPTCPLALCLGLPGPVLMPALLWGGGGGVILSPVCVTHDVFWTAGRCARLSHTCDALWCRWSPLAFSGETL